MITRSTKVISISVLSSQASEIEKMAKSERKSKSELIRDALAVYKLSKFDRDWVKIRKLGEKTRKRFNFKTEEDLFEFIHSD